MSHPGEGFKARALRLQPVCAVCGRTGPMEIHHVITKQHLRRELGREIAERARWDLRNVMTLCTKDHRAHHACLPSIGRSFLSAENYSFAAEHGLEWLLEKTYPTEDTDGL